MATYKDLVEAGANYRPAHWEIAKTICYWADSDDTPDIPIPKDWKLLRKDTKDAEFPPRTPSSMT